MIKNIFFLSILCLGYNCGGSSSKYTPVTSSKVVSTRPCVGNGNGNVVTGSNKLICNKEHKGNSYLPSSLSEEKSSYNDDNRSFSSRKERLKNKPKGSLNKQLDKAIRDQDPELVDSLLSAGADPNNNELGFYPLDKAVNKNNVEIVQILLNAGAKIEVDNNGFIGVLYSAESKDKRILETLLIHLALFGKKDDDGLSPLHWAAKDGYPGVVKALIDSNQALDYNEVDPVYGFTPLHYAARKGNIEVVKMLLSKGADKTALSESCFTPLMLAISNERNENLIQLLSPDGFDRSTKEPEKVSLDISLEACSICFELFNPFDLKNPVVVLPCSIHHRFHKECIDEWYKKKYNSCPICRSEAPNYKKYSNIIKDDNYYQSLLISSIQNGEKKSFDASLTYGADPNKPDEQSGDYPLVLTLKSTSHNITRDMIKSLIKRGAYINKDGIASILLEYSGYKKLFCEAGAFDNTFCYREQRSFNIPLDKELF